MAFIAHMVQEKKQLVEKAEAILQNAEKSGRLIQLTAKKLACFSQTSNELIADGMSFEEMLAGALIKGIGWYMDYAFINGIGEGQPLGILNDPALITVAKEEDQSIATITYQNVVNMFSRLAPSCFTNAVWLANPSVIPQLLTMTITIGTGGAQIPVFKEEASRFTLLGKEIIFTEKCPALGAKGDLILADLSQYAIGMRKEIALDRSNVPGWMEDMTDYRVIVRVDGQGTWDKPITPKNGTTLSWAVALETVKKERIHIYQKRNTCFIGIDMHKDIHCAVVIDCWMNKLGEISFENRPSKFPAFVENVRTICSNREVVFGLEDTRGFGRNLAAYLVGRKFEVKHVNPAYTSAVRLASPIVHKDDSYDAYCVARVLRDMVDTLPDAKHEDIFWTIRQLVK